MALTQLTTEDDRHPEKARPGAESAPAHLFRLLECEHPLAGPARSILGSVQAVSIGRRSTRGAEWAGGRLSLFAPDPRMSSAHAQLRRAEGGWLLEDAGSKNGTLVNGVPVRERLLEDGDLIEAGRTFFLFRESLPAARGAATHVEAAELRGPAGLLTLHPQLQAAFDGLRAVAPSRLPILIRGETGTGKELAAAAVHELSGRAGALQPVNCAALAPALLEAELFGHKKGAFSGALEDRPGLLRASDGGTLFLDEVGELSLQAQAALLRATQEAEVTPVGGTKAVKVDLRLVVATHRDLTLMVESGGFRADLLARLQGHVLQLLPLRERLMDLGLIAGAILRRHARDPERVQLEPEAARALFRHVWQGNVRELDLALAAALLLSQGAPIGLAHLPEPVRGPKAPPPSQAPAELSLADQQRRAQIVESLARNNGNLSAVARELGKGRTQLQRWIKRYRIER